MKEIKFRAWNKEGKQMESIDFLGKNAVKIHNSEWENIEDFIIMQYTGLKDKNEVEIYEGDIVKNCEGNLYQVIWYNNGFKFLYKFNVRGYLEKNILGLGDTNSRRWGIEIIGNIYENSELLEGK